MHPTQCGHNLDLLVTKFNLIYNNLSLNPIMVLCIYNFGS